MDETEGWWVRVPGSKVGDGEGNAVKRNVAHKGALLPGGATSALNGSIASAGRNAGVSRKNLRVVLPSVWPLALVFPENKSY